MIPLMTSRLLRLSQHQAHGTSLAAVTATGCAGAISYQEYVDYPAAGAVAVTAMITSVAGARLTTFMSASALRRALGILLLIMGPAVPAKAYFMEQQEERNRNRLQATVDQEKEVDWKRRFAAPAAIGIGSGFLSGLFGVGGGTVTVPALTYAHTFPDSSQTVHHQALATSLAAMTMPAFVGTCTHASAGNVAFRVAPPLAAGALCGAYLGGKVALETSESTLRWGFSALLTVLGIRTLLK